MKTEDKNRKTGNAPEETPDTPMEEGLDDINPASADSQDNVISNTHSKVANKKHGRKRGDPLTGASPKAI